MLQVVQIAWHYVHFTCLVFLFAMAEEMSMQDFLDTIEWKGKNEAMVQTAVDILVEENDLLVSWHVLVVVRALLFPSHLFQFVVNLDRVKMENLILPERLSAGKRAFIEEVLAQYAKQFGGGDAEEGGRTLPLGRVGEAAASEADFVEQGGAPTAGPLGMAQCPPCFFAYRQRKCRPIAPDSVAQHGWQASERAYPC